MKKHKQVLQGRRGFTLMELLIVGIILAVIAGLAIPGYLSTVERSRRQEALEGLGAIRQAQARFFTGANAYTNNFNQLDVNPNVTAGGNPHFAYVTAPNGAADFTATATRNAVDFNAASGCTAGYTVTINKVGTIAGAGC